MPRVNRAIELLEQGQPIYYTGTADRGFEGGVKAAKTWADYITYEMEHAPFDVSNLADFMRGLVAGGPTRSGHRTPTVIVTLPMNGSDEQSVNANAWMIKPKNLESGKHYPLLMWVYGGPGSQTVLDSWAGSQYLWYQMLAQQGYLVVSVDNRGTGARGARFRKLTYLRLGHFESADQISAARFFGSLPYVDASRIGIWGWSYGGYVASRTMFLGGDVFRAAIAVAPVTDWRFYDTIYTERYMRTPAENPQGYDESSSLAYADSLRGSFLVVHGTGDDNVHFQNTVRLVERLEKANKQFDMRIYPNKTHAISGGNTTENLFGFLTEWLKRSL